MNGRKIIADYFVIPAGFWQESIQSENWNFCGVSPPYAEALLFWQKGPKPLMPHPA